MQYLKKISFTSTLCHPVQLVSEIKKSVIVSQQTRFAEEILPKLSSFSVFFGIMHVFQEEVVLY